MYLFWIYYVKTLYVHTAITNIFHKHFLSLKIFSKDITRDLQVQYPLSWIKPSTTAPWAPDPAKILHAHRGQDLTSHSILVYRISPGPLQQRLQTHIHAGRGESNQVECSKLPWNILNGACGAPRTYNNNLPNRGRIEPHKAIACPRPRA